MYESLIFTNNVDYRENFLPRSQFLVVHHDVTKSRKMENYVDSSHWSERHFDFAVKKYFRENENENERGLLQGFSFTFHCPL